MGVQSGSPLHLLLKVVKMMKIFLVALVTIFAIAEAGRIRRDTDECDKITVAHKECVKTAYDDYVAAHGAGDDGRGDWEARKSCNYVNAAVGECGDLLSGCYEEEETTAQKDHQVETILKQLERTVGGWDSSKCPVVREYLERQADNADDGEEEENGDGDQGDEEGADDAEEDVADDGEPSEDEDNGEAEEEGMQSEDGEGEEGDEEAVEDDAEQVNEEADNDEAEDEEEEEEESDNGDDENSSTALFSSFAMMMACLSVIV